MNRNLRKILRRSMVSLLFLWFFAVGGCDIKFSSDGDNGGGGGGGGGSNIETVEGTIASITPDQDVEGITVEISVDNGPPETGVTNASGFFSIEGPLAGSPLISFSDEDSIPPMPLGTIGISVFPTAKVELGDITINNGAVSLDDPSYDVTFNGDISSNNCTGNTGFMEIEAENNQGKVTVIVQISESTDLIINGDDAECEDFLLGRNVEVQGETPTVNTVDAFRIEID